MSGEGTSSLVFVDAENGDEDSIEVVPSSYREDPNLQVSGASGSKNDREDIVQVK